MKYFADSTDGFYERMSRLREMEIGLDGVICAKGGEVRVHLAYMAGCNQSLFNRITSLLKQGKNELNAKTISFEGVQRLVACFYSGEMEINEDNFQHIVDAALGLEFLDIVESCIAFAFESEANANVWCHFMRTAFKHPRSIQPPDFVPNLILTNIAEIPMEAIITGLDAAFIREILEHGTVNSEKKSYTLSVFLEMILADKVDIQTYKETIRLMRDIVEQATELTIPARTVDKDILSLMELGLELNFDLLVEACVTALKEIPPTAEVTSQVLKWLKQFARTAVSDCLNGFVHHAFTNLQHDITEDDVCIMLESNHLGQMQEFDIYKQAFAWMEQNNASAATNLRITSLVRFGLMTKEEMDEVIRSFLIPGCGDIFAEAMRYHLCLYDQPLADERMNKLRQVQPQIYIMAGKDETNNYNKSVYTSRSAKNKGNYSFIPFTKVCESPFALSRSACAELNGFLFVSGGEGDSGSVSDLHRFDTRTCSWLELQPMSQARQFHTMTAVEALLIVVGGQDKQNVAGDKVEVYDIKENKWSGMLPLPAAPTQHAASFVDGVLFVSGGSGQLQKALFCLSDNLTRWEKRSPMLCGRQAHAMTGVSGILITVGGAAMENGTWKSVTTTECYDIVQDQWTELSPPAHPCFLGCPMRIGGCFYILGGSSTTTDRLDCIQKYKMESDEWELEEIKLPSKIAGLVGVSITS